MSELSLHPITFSDNNSNKLTSKRHFLQKKSNSTQDLLLLSQNNNNNSNINNKKNQFLNLSITMSRFNKENNPTDTSNDKESMFSPRNKQQIIGKRINRSAITTTIPNKRRINKPSYISPNNNTINNSGIILKNDSMLFNSLNSSQQNIITNEYSMSPQPPSTPSMDPFYKKIVNVTPQPSYVITDPMLVTMTKNSFNNNNNNIINNIDQISSSRINNSTGVSPNRIPTQANSPLENTIFSNNGSPTISPEHTTINQQLSNNNNNNNNNSRNIVVVNPTGQYQSTNFVQSTGTPLNNQDLSQTYDFTNNNNNTDKDMNNNNNSNNNIPNNNNDVNNESNDNNNNNNNDDDDKDTGDENNNNGNNRSNGKKTGQALIQKLQDIYKLIVKQEIELQDRCAQLTTSQTTELKNLWTIYKINVDLINNYTTFITTALLPSQSPQDILIGEEIIEIYRIERRLWVYGTITFLDVLKNFSNFMDPDVCSQFITHVFISLSTMLIDIPPKHSIPWLQRLGDLSRMAIALYPSGFIDWKLSAEYWYLEAMKFTYNHGKLYYHMSTVQQNTLEAFVNLGKSVFCQDTFTPSQQYMQLVIDNIYQRTFVDRTNNGNIRNSDLIDYLKHSEVMLLPTFLENTDLQRVVLNYFQDRFGIDYNENNIFQTQKMFNQIPSSLRFYFRHAPAFAESHILQIIGFGDPKNPFAILFDLPKYLKERKDKKDKNRSRTTDSSNNNNNNNSNSNVGGGGSGGGSNTTNSIAPSSATTTTANSPVSTAFSITDLGSDMSIDQEQLQISTTAFFDNIDSLKEPIRKADVYVWIKSLDFVNLTSLKCSMIVLKKFLHGPLLIALPHFLPWAYFIVATVIKAKREFQFNDESSLKFWNVLIKRLFPWDTIVSFLNVLLAYILDNIENCEMIEKICNQCKSLNNLEELIQYFNSCEELPEVWKCWGTLWYDVISDKGSLKAETFKDLGISDHMFLDLPIDGIDLDINDENGDKFWKRSLRLIFIFKKIAEEFDIGLKLSRDVSVYCNNPNIDNNHILRSFCFKAEPYIEETSERFNEMIPLCETISDINSNFNEVPSLSVIPGENIFNYIGYKKFTLNGESFDKNGDIISCSLYSSYLSNNGNATATNSNNNNNGSSGSVIMDNTNNISKPSTDIDLTGTNTSNLVSTNLIDTFNDEEQWFERYMGNWKSFNSNDMTQLDIINKDITYFVFDATSWLRHFAHIYKLATNGVLKFAVCLTTFQELRFLRKSKDENVVEAAARAIITMRQLYREGKLLPLRFTGNIAADIEEHLEVEEQITWRSHVDEFVIEAVMKAQLKFKDNSIGIRNDFNYVVLVTDDITMAKKAKDQQVMTFSTHFMFSLCTKMGLDDVVCTN